jgi:putative membrane protein insertion efficiency factor
MWISGSRHPNLRLTARGVCFLLLSVFFLTGVPLRAEIGLILLYQRIGSPVAQYLVTCRYQPTCSVYALEKLEECGFWKGNFEISKRLLMCSPFGCLVDALADHDPS